MKTPRRVVPSYLAEQDLLEIADYLGTEAGQSVSDRFADAFSRTCHMVWQLPMLGRSCGFTSPESNRIRRINIRGRFDRWLVFYTPMDGYIRVDRVLHGSKNWLSLFP